MRANRWSSAVVAVMWVAVAADARPRTVIVPPSAARFTALDPHEPHGAQIAIVSGDRNVGPVAFYLKLERGVTPLHWHSSDYYAVLISGELKHASKGRDAEAATNPTGTAWFQPGGSRATAHTDECMTASCTLFVTMVGKLDVIPVVKATHLDCTSVVADALDRSMSEGMRDVTDMTPDQRQAAIDLATELMPAMKRTMAKVCQDDQWAVAAIQCIADGDTQADLQACEAMLTARQRAHMQKATSDAMTAHASAANANGLPRECNDYKAQLIRLGACDQLPQASKDALKQGFEAMEQSWANMGALPPDARAAMASGCQAGADALRQTGAAVCGW